MRFTSILFPLATASVLVLAGCQTTAPTLPGKTRPIVTPPGPDGEDSSIGLLHEITFEEIPLTETLLMGTLRTAPAGTGVALDRMYEYVVNEKEGVEVNEVYHFETLNEAITIATDLFMEVAPPDPTNPESFIIIEDWLTENWITPELYYVATGT